MTREGFVAGFGQLIEAFSSSHNAAPYGIDQATPARVHRLELLSLRRSQPREKRYMQKCSGVLPGHISAFVEQLLADTSVRKRRC